MLQANNIGTLTGILNKVLDELKITSKLEPIDQDKPQYCRLLRKLCKSLNLVNQTLLFILDDAQGKLLIKEIRDCILDILHEFEKRFKFLITTRDQVAFQDYRERERKVRLAAFSQLEGKEYVKKNVSKEISKKDIKCILSGVGLIPSNLERIVERINAVSYKETTQHILDYIANFQDHLGLDNLSDSEALLLQAVMEEAEKKARRIWVRFRRKEGIDVPMPMHKVEDCGIHKDKLDDTLDQWRKLSLVSINRNNPANTVELWICKGLISSYYIYGYHNFLQKNRNSVILQSNS